MANTKILGLDIGEKRIGVAIADANVPFPAPLTTLEASDNLSTQFTQLIEKNHVSVVVVGYPRNQKGEPTAQTKQVEQVVSLLNIPSTVKVVWQDESLTSVKAEDELKRRGKAYQKGDIDALAATYILNDYVTAQHQASQPMASPATVPPTKQAHHSHHAKPNSTRQKPRLSLNKAIMLGLAGVMLAAIIGSGIWYAQALGPRTADDVYHVVKIKSGTPTSQIADDLREAEVIKSATAFSLYVRLNGISNLQAGTYRLSSAKSTPAIASTIADGKVTSTNVLISPGLRLDQIKALLVKDGYSEDQIDLAIAAVREHPVLVGYPSSARLEGYLYPDTYQIDPDTTATELLTKILDNLDSSISKDMREGITQQGLTLPEAISLASIVQKEVSDPATQRTVAQVFLTRLSQGMVLGSDVTYKYAAAQFGTIDSPSSSSPYNTRKFPGLPPTPISNFNLSALKAVANPTNTDYLYFVAGDDGTTHFSRTLEGHEANIAKYCQKGCG